MENQKNKNFGVIKANGSITIGDNVSDVGTRRGFNPEFIGFDPDLDLYQNNMNVLFAKKFGKNSNIVTKSVTTKGDFVLGTNNTI